MVDTQQHIFQLQYTSMLSQQPPNFNIHMQQMGMMMTVIKDTLFLQNK